MSIEKYFGVVKKIDEDDGKVEVVINDLDGNPETMYLKIDVLARFDALYEGAEFNYVVKDGERSIEVLNPEKRPPREVLEPLDFRSTMYTFLDNVKKQKEGK